MGISPGAESKQPPSQSCSRPMSSVPPVGIVLPWARTTDHSCSAHSTAHQDTKKAMLDH